MVDKKELLNIVNASGYPFQIYIENTINNSQYQHGWEVLSSEHRWISSEMEHDNFIDIILGSPSHADYRAVIECKKTQNANWIFLVPDDKRPIAKATTLYTNIYKNIEPLVEYYDLSIQPHSLESSFCAIRGSDGQNDKPMLERISTQLIKSAECLAIQELELNKNQFEKMTFYFPIIITNANLFACCFNPSSVNHETGKLESDDIKLEPIEFIRFTKTLSSKFDSYFKASASEYRNLESLRWINQLDRRTVFVVRATAMIDFLSSCEIKGNYPDLVQRIESHRSQKRSLSDHI